MTALAEGRRAAAGAAGGGSRFLELDGLRGLAALLVVLHHMRGSVNQLDPPASVTRFMDGTFVMVDLFFVLSGFVLARHFGRIERLADARAFVVRRVRRFAPLHAAAWLLMLGYLVTLLVRQRTGVADPGVGPAFGDPRYSAEGWLTSSVLLQGFVGPDLAGYGPGWSLSIELGVNALVAVAVLVLPWRVLLGALAAGGVALLLLAAPDASPTVGMPAAGRGLLGIGLGAAAHTLLLARARGRAPRPRWWPGAAAAAALVLLLGLCLAREDVLRLRFLPVHAVAVVLVLALATGRSPLHAALRSGPAQWLGARSFALYALHTPIVLACRDLRRTVPLPDAVAAPLFPLVTLTACLAVAHLGHRWVEGRLSR